MLSDFATDNRLQGLVIYLPNLTSISAAILSTHLPYGIQYDGNRINEQTIKSTHDECIKIYVGLLYLYCLS